MIGFKRKKNTPPSPSPAIPVAIEEDVKNPGELVTQVAFELRMDVINSRLDNSNLLMTGVLVALGICFVTLFFGYWQFASTSFNDYSQKVKDLNDKRYEFQQTEIDYLEKIATTGAKFK